MRRQLSTQPYRRFGLLATACISVLIGGVGAAWFNQDDSTGDQHAVAAQLTQQELLEDAFERTWRRIDGPVAAALVDRTWMWGPAPIAAVCTEPYVDAPGGNRFVLYYDKSRMEVTDPNADSTAPWYVTNGLLVVELVSGRLQIGSNAFEERTPAEENVAGDDGPRNGPTYATLASLLDAPPAANGAVITQRVDHTGTVTNDSSLASYAATAAYRVIMPGIDHQVASPFGEFMQSSGPIQEGEQIVEGPLFENPFYATGYPITEAYWATVRIAGVPRDVLLQCFERRCLTWTPTNQSGWQVESGNVGRHYYRWRYESDAEVVQSQAVSTGKFDAITVDSRHRAS